MHFTIIDCVCVVFLSVEAQNWCFNSFQVTCAWVYFLNIILSMWYLHFDVAYWSKTWVVCSHNMVILIVISNRTVIECTIESFTPWPFIRGVSECLWQVIVNKLDLLRVIFLHCFIKLVGVVISNILFGGSRHSIMMLVETHSVLHQVLSFQNIIEITFTHWLI